MHPELLSSLAAEHRRDLAARTVRRPVPARTAPSLGTPPLRRALRSARGVAVPRLRVSWSRTTLSAMSGSRRGKSLVIVISATRTF